MSAAPCNVDAPIVEVRHADLLRLPGDDSAYRRACPTCKQGMLLVGRARGTLILLDHDLCVLCAQRVRYLDIDTLRGLDWAGKPA